MTGRPAAPPLAAVALEFTRAVRGEHAKALAPLGLHPGQDLLLAEVWESPGLRLTTLAERLGVEPPTVTRMVARLERGGLVERRRDPDDGRAGLVFATPRSRLLEAGVRRAWASLEAALGSAHPPDEVEALRSHLASAASRLRARGR